MKLFCYLGIHHYKSDGTGPKKQLQLSSTGRPVSIEYMWWHYKYRKCKRCGKRQRIKRIYYGPRDRVLMTSPKCPPYYKWRTVHNMFEA